MAKNKVVSDRLNTFFSNNKLVLGEGIPTTGTWSKGDIIISSTQEDSNAWICVEAGTPGKWEDFGASGSGGGNLVTTNGSFVTDIACTEVSLSSLGVMVDKKRDKLMVHYNSTHLLENVDFYISDDGSKIVKVGAGQWNESAIPNSIFTFELLKSVKSLDNGGVTIDSRLGTLKSVKRINVKTNEVEIGIMGFNKQNDLLMVFKNSTYLTEGVDYEVDFNGTKITTVEGFWNEENLPNQQFVFVCIKEVPIIQGAEQLGTENLQNASITMDKLAQDVKTEMNKPKSSIGDLATLQTENKGDLVAAINEVFQSASKGKTLLASMLTGLGQASEPTESWEVLVSRIQLVIPNVPELAVTFTQNIGSVTAVISCSNDVAITNYRINGGAWQSTGTFTGITGATDCSFEVQYGNSQTAALYAKAPKGLQSDTDITCTLLSSGTYGIRVSSSTGHIKETTTGVINPSPWCKRASETTASVVIYGVKPATSTLEEARKEFTFSKPTSAEGGTNITNTLTNNELPANFGDWSHERVRWSYGQNDFTGYYKVTGYNPGSEGYTGATRIYEYTLATPLDASPIIKLNYEWTNLFTSYIFVNDCKAVFDIKFKLDNGEWTDMFRVETYSSMYDKVEYLRIPSGNKITGYKLTVACGFMRAYENSSSYYSGTLQFKLSA